MFALDSIHAGTLCYTKQSFHLCSDYIIFLFQPHVSSSNWTNTSSTISSLSAQVSRISVSEHHNSTMATISTAINFIHNRSSLITAYNQTIPFEKNARSQQDQCWETYVGQVSQTYKYTHLWMSLIHLEICTRKI